MSFDGQPFGSAPFAAQSSAQSGYAPPLPHLVVFQFKGAYAPPANYSANFAFVTAGYTPPANNAANFNFAPPAASYSPPAYNGITFVFGTSGTAISGVSSTTAVGTLAQLYPPLTLGGDIGTGAAGAVAPALTLALTGVASASGIGALAPAQGVSGVSSTGNAGTLAPSIIAAAAGVAASGQIGRAHV